LLNVTNTNKGTHIQIRNIRKTVLFIIMENRIKDEIECVQSTFPETTIVVETCATKRQHSDKNDSSNENKKVSFSLPLTSLVFNDEDEEIQLIKGGKVVFTLSSSRDPNANEKKKKDFMSVMLEFRGNVPKEIIRRVFPCDYLATTDNRNIMTEFHNNDNSYEEDEEDQLVLMEVFRIQQIVQDFIASSSSLIKDENTANSKSQARTVNDESDFRSSSLLDNERFCEGLRECGFVQCGHTDDLWVERTGGRGVTIERDNDQPVIGGVWVSCDGLNPQDVADFLRLMFERKGDDNEVDYDTWPKQILQWARANVGDGFEEDATDEEEQDEIGDDLYSDSAEIETLYLNPELKLLANPNRELKISTWGRALMKNAPTGAVNFNAAVLSGRGHGVNTKKMNGLCLEVQTAVSKCSLFPTWMELVIRKIERDDLCHIAVNCTKGRHRSVAAAELLKRLYYKRADVHHLTIV